jgi:hypothetical protein
MTAFPAATDFNSPEAANRRLANAAFLQTRDLQFYDRLVLEIQRLSHPGENIPLPDPAEMGCWQRAYACYETLRDRAAVEEHRAVQRSQAFRDYERDWNQYIQDRESILAGLRADVFDEFTLIEHLGLQKDDLGDVLVKGRNRDGEYRHPDWVKRADRLASAIRWWHALSGEEKRTLRQMRVVRKLEAAKQERSDG